MRSGARWAARQFVPLDDGGRGLGRLRPLRKPESLRGTLWIRLPSRWPTWGSNMLFGDIEGCSAQQGTWPIGMGPRQLTRYARAVVGHHGPRWPDLATTLAPHALEWLGKTSASRASLLHLMR
ncbi:hypothetical protein Taro_034249 [Colocasia esculenta]|uniref:Uncharacterized protein n=1 Tax=Colocasia esculenta TaxID=4460 RepID=A0A843W2E5_COLES|nr:hypothetical protein [Colocasia esculenta]